MTVVERGAPIEAHLDALVAGFVSDHGLAPWEAALGMAEILRRRYPMPPTGWENDPPES